MDSEKRQIVKFTSRCKVIAQRRYDSVNGRQSLTSGGRKIEVEAIDF